MYAVGLTGGIGSGKTAVADRLAERGAAIVDADQLAHAVTAPGGPAMPAILEAFGASFVAADGSLDRARMRQLVFDDPTAKTRLERILHPLISAQCDAAAAAAQGCYLVYVVPLLVEAGERWRTRVQRIVVVDCSVETQIERVMRRSALQRKQVEAIIANQATRTQRLKMADDVIVNEGNNLQQLRAETDALHKKLLALAVA